MYRLRLIKSLSYTGDGIKATREKPVVETESKEISDRLTASGYFSFIGEAEPKDEKPQKAQSKKAAQKAADANEILTGD